MYFGYYTTPFPAAGILCAYQIIERISAIFGCEPPFIFRWEVQPVLNITKFFINLPLAPAVYG
jgi:hypothetical protein